jgi:hypothetical protein
LDKSQKKKKVRGYPFRTPSFIFYLSPLLGYKISLILQQNELNYNLLPGKYIQHYGYKQNRRRKN